MESEQDRREWREREWRERESGERERERERERGERERREREVKAHTSIKEGYKQSTIISVAVSLAYSVFYIHLSILYYSFGQAIPEKISFLQHSYYSLLKFLSLH
jgi:hypothetical protein